MTPPRCIVFDVDDTLYLERDYVRSGFAAVGRRVSERLGIHDLAERCWTLFSAGIRGRIFDLALAEAGVTAEPALVRELVDVYRAHAPAIALLPDASACLERLASRARLAAISDGPSLAQRNKVRALQLERWLEPIILTEELEPGHGKPDPLAYELVQRAAGIGGAACVYVADNPLKDFGGPKQLGWRTIRIRRPGGLHRARPSGPDVDEEWTDLSRLGGW